MSLRLWALIILLSLASFSAFADSSKSCGGTLRYFEHAEIIDKYKNIKGWIEGVQNHREGPFLSIVIPAYKEEARLPDSIKKMKDFFDEFPIPVQVLIIVEKSPDHTLSAAQEAAGGDPRITVVDNIVQRGKGYAVRSGMLKSQGEITFFMDADLSTPLYEVIRFLDWMRENPETDVVIGDRVKAISSDKNSRSLLRKTLSSGFKTALNWASPLDFSDTQAGFKAFRSGARQRIFENQVIDGFAFDVEVLLLAKQLGYVTKSKEIDWMDDRRSTVRPFVDPAKMLIDIFRIQSITRERLAPMVRRAGSL